MVQACVFNILTWKCALRHNGDHNFQKCSEPVSFYTFDFETCSAPERRALFRHLNFQRCSENGVFSTFWLGNVLRATTAYTFWTSQLPKVVREWFFNIHPASRGVAAHTAGLFRSVRGAKGSFPLWGLPKLGNFHFPPVGAPQAREFSLFPPVGAPQAREFSLFPPVGAPQAREFSLSPRGGSPS